MELVEFQRMVDNAHVQGAQRCYQVVMIIV